MGRQAQSVNGAKHSIKLGTATWSTCEGDPRMSQGEAEEMKNGHSNLERIRGQPRNVTGGEAQLGKGEATQSTFTNQTHFDLL